MIRLRVLDDSAQEPWDALVRQFSEATIFHTWAWMQVVERPGRVERIPLGIYQGADLVGVFPMFRVRRGPATMLASPAGAVGYGGPLVEEGLRSEVFGDLDRIGRTLRADIVEIRLAPGLDRSMLSEGRYAVQELRTHTVPLRADVEQMWHDLKGRCRTAIRKARASGVEIAEASDVGFLETYYAMAADTYAKSGRMPPNSVDDYKAAWDALSPQDALKVLLAKHGGQVVAGLMALRFRGTLYYWDGASLRAHYDLCASNLLQWTLMEWGAQNGLLHYDLMGANIPSIARFKESFGGESETYNYVHKTISLRAALGRPVYNWIARRVGRARYWLHNVLSTRKA